MNKNELIAVMAGKAEMTKKDTAIALSAFQEAVSEALANGEKVAISGFGTFTPKERAERVGRNPQTGAEIAIPAKTVATFKASKVLKDLLA